MTAHPDRSRIDRPYAAEHAASRRFAPKGLPGLVRWFVTGWRAELPSGDIHGAGVEWEKPGRIIRSDGSGVTDPGGGSRLGSPRLSPDFRDHVFGTPSRTEHATSGGAVEIGESYASPMRWTVTWLETHGRKPLMASVLRWLGRVGEDWRGQGLTVTCGSCTGSVTLPDEYSEAIVRDALGLAAKHYREEPEAKVA